ncbi:MAG TPA: DUF6457 domain-containing protein [Solirubrobacterales bacterium]|jgi:hypothetical protein|nr:DUF6457 domain-containing protein [Solirubrobacterales bacterium]
MRRDEWIADFCERIGVEPPGKEEVAALLDLAATAAHSSERTAAPLACWVAGRRSAAFTTSVGRTPS